MPSALKVEEEIQNERLKGSYQVLGRTLCIILYKIDMLRGSGYYFLIRSKCSKTFIPKE